MKLGDNKLPIRDADGLAETKTYRITCPNPDCEAVYNIWGMEEHGVWTPNDDKELETCVECGGELDE